MLRLVDLTRTIDPEDFNRLPSSLRAVPGVTGDMRYLEPGGEGAELFCRAFGCERHDLPDGEAWAAELLEGFTSHTGTHVDAPLHSGSTCEGRPARTITDIEVDELFCEAMVLDLRGAVGPNETISIEALEAALAAVGRGVKEGDAVLLRTGQERYSLSDPEFAQHPGMSREGTLLLAERGAKVLGTDAVGWDRPIPAMRAAFERTGDPSELWDGHFACRDKEVFIVQQLVSLSALPPSGFKVAFFPLKLARASGAPARVVAFLEAGETKEAPSGGRGGTPLERGPHGQ